MEISAQKHTIAPVFNSDSKVLILGTFPSVKSRQSDFFYGHPCNRFWKVIANIVNCDIPQSTEQKKAMLLKNKIALWDVIKSCDIAGSSDSSIKNVVSNDLDLILSNCNISNIYANGKKAGELYNKYINLGQEIIVLPSTSPANASYSLEKLIENWKCIL
ncbi:MAG: DNA-deoxyinosine glycosylase [Clostridia bacterium]|nr:DNA-deoxyinosine glycosylase [Clostridia bacterium]